MEKDGGNGGVGERKLKFLDECFDKMEYIPEEREGKFKKRD